MKKEEEREGGAMDKAIHTGRGEGLLTGYKGKRRKQRKRMY